MRDRPAQHRRPLLSLLARLEVVHFPLLMDHKLRGQKGEGLPGRLPEAEIGLVSGSVAHEEHLAVLREMRQKSTFLDGPRHLRHPWRHSGHAERVVPSGGSAKPVFSTAPPAPAVIPTEGLPVFLDRVYSIDEKVKVDLSLPGCPPNPQQIAEALEAILNHQEQRHTGKKRLRDLSCHPGG